MSQEGWEAFGGPPSDPAPNPGRHVSVAGYGKSCNCTGLSVTALELSGAIIMHCLHFWDPGRTHPLPMHWAAEKKMLPDPHCYLPLLTPILGKGNNKFRLPQTSRIRINGCVGPTQAVRPPRCRPVRTPGGTCPKLASVSDAPSSPRPSFHSLDDVI